MKKILVLLLVSLFVAPGCKYFSKGSADLEKKNAQLQSALANEKVLHTKDLEQLKMESQQKLDSLQANCLEASNRYNIIVGAFKVPANADGYLQQMSSKGYTAKIVAAGSFQMVSVGSFGTLREALGQLGNFRDAVTRDAWIYVR
jgi:cell division protein FtsN